MGGKYYKDPTADAAMANIKRQVKNRKDEEERIQKRLNRLFQRMSSIGMSRKEMVDMLKHEFQKFLKKYD